VTRRRDMRVRRTATWTLAAVAIAVGYGWWATGVQTFTTVAYLAVAIPAVVVLTASLVTGRMTERAPSTPATDQRGGAATSGRSTLPLAAVVVAAVVLEIIGLALGGHSSTVPTLSDVADRAIARHLLRAIAFGLWLAIGTSGAVARLRHRTSGVAR
jgi:hypothetical protein